MSAEHTLIIIGALVLACLLALLVLSLFALRLFGKISFDLRDMLRGPYTRSRTRAFMTTSATMIDTYSNL